MNMLSYRYNNLKRRKLRMAIVIIDIKTGVMPVTSSSSDGWAREADDPVYCAPQRQYG